MSSENVKSSEQAKNKQTNKYSGTLGRIIWTCKECSFEGERIRKPEHVKCLSYVAFSIFTTLNSVI